MDVVTHAPSITVTLVPLGVAETGIWCDRCLLPSGMRFMYAITFPGVRSPSVHVLTRCVDCQEPIT